MRPTARNRLLPFLVLPSSTKYLYSTQVLYKCIPLLAEVFPQGKLEWEHFSFCPCELHCVGHMVLYSISPLLPNPVFIYLQIQSALFLSNPIHSWVEINFLFTQGTSIVRCFCIHQNQTHQYLYLVFRGFSPFLSRFQVPILSYLELVSTDHPGLNHQVLTHEPWRTNISSQLKYWTGFSMVRVPSLNLVSTGITLSMMDGLVTEKDRGSGECQRRPEASTLLGLSQFKLYVLTWNATLLLLYATNLQQKVDILEGM